MKKNILIFLAIQMMLVMSGCTLPFIGEIPGTSADESGQEMLTLAASGTAAGIQQATTDNRTSDVNSTLVNGLASSYSVAGNNQIPVEMSGNTPGAVSFESTAGAIGTALTGGAASIVTTGGAISTTPTGEAGDISSSSGMVSMASSGGAVNLTGEPITTGGVAVVASSAYEETIPAGTAVAGEEYRLSQETGDISETRYPVTVYYQDGSGCLIPMTRWIERQPGIAKAVVGLVTDSPIAREELAYYGVYPVLPANTRIIGVNLLDGIAIIDFDKNLLQYSDKQSERNIVASVVYTLTEFNSISGVQIRINGKETEQLRFGTDISGVLDRGNTAINANLQMEKENGRTGQKADVFVLKKANEGFTYMMPLSVQTNNAGPESEAGNTTAQLLLRQLTAVNLGEAAAVRGAFSEIPAGVVIQGCTEKDGTVTVDFSGNFVKYGGNEKEESILKQLAYTIRQIDGIRRLDIMVEGSPVQLPEGTDLSSGLKIPQTINDVIDR